MLEISFIIVVVLALCLWLFNPLRFTPPKTAPSDQRTYEQFEPVLSLFVNRPELRVYHELRRTLPDKYYVQSKVRLEDIITVKSSIKNPETRWKLRGRVKSRHVDFLVIDEVGKPIFAIELDGAAHEDSESFNADTLKNGLFKTVGIPLYRVLVNDDYLLQIRNIVKDMTR